MAKCLYFRQTMATNNQDSNDPPSASHGVSNSTSNCSMLSSSDFDPDTLNLDPLLANEDVSLGLTDAILETDFFLGNAGIYSNNEMEICKPDSNNDLSTSNTVTPTNTSPMQTPLLGRANTSILIPPPTYKTATASNDRGSYRDQSEESGAFSDISSNTSSVSDSGSWTRSALQSESKHSGIYRSLATGLDTIPEDGVTNPPTVYQPLVPPAIATPVTTSYNISFPTTLQPRDRFDVWLRTNLPSNSQQRFMVNGYNSPGEASSSVPQSPGSLSSHQSPFHGATVSTPWDGNDLQPMNVIKEELPPKTSTPPTASIRAKCVKSANKRTRSSQPSSEHGGDEDDIQEGASSRQRRKSTGNGNNNNALSSETKRKESIKYGLEELQRVLPNVGTPEETRISQASVLHEGGKHIKNLGLQQDKLANDIEAVKKHIDDLNNQIESLQNLLPANGAPLLPKVMTMKALPDQFHDHVVQKTKENWKYWVFVSIMGHFVHSFEQQVAAPTYEELETTAVEYVANNLTLQQLRKDAYRKLAKLCSKTSIVETPSKLPEEAIGFVTRGERAFKKENS